MTGIDADHILRQRAWSRATFGPGRRTGGVIDHLKKELAEIEHEAAGEMEATHFNPGGQVWLPLLGEWVDAIILALDGAWRTGATPDQIIAAIKEKQSRNEERQWPDWRTAPPDKAIEHVRTREPS